MSQHPMSRQVALQNVLFIWAGGHDPIWGNIAPKMIVQASEGIFG